MFELQSDKNKEELLKYGEMQIQKEKSIEDYLQNGAENLQLDDEKLFAKYAKKNAAVQITKDMPENDPNEKESKQRKKQKEDLQAQTEELFHERSGQAASLSRKTEYMRAHHRLDAESKKIFEDTLNQELFSPNHILKNFTAVRKKLDTWRDHLKLFENGAGTALMAKGEAIRLGMMREMYEKGERAFESALAALGLRCEIKKNGSLKLTEKGNAKQREQALKENMQLRRELAEQGNLDERVVDVLIEDGKVDFEQDIKQMRQDMKNSEKFSFISSEHLSNIYHYEDLQNVKELFGEYPEKYQENKSVLDKMYQEFFHLIEVNGIYNLSAMPLSNLGFAPEQYGTGKIQRVMNKRLDFYKDKQMIIRDRAECIKAGIKHILKGTKLTNRESLVVREYMRPKEDGELQRRESEAAAGTYADIYREKKAIFDSLAEEMYGKEGAELLTEGSAGRYMMLMEPEKHEHNREVLHFLLLQKTAQTLIRGGGEAAVSAQQELGRAAKNLVLPYMQKIKDFSTEQLENYSDEELLEHAEELQELYISGMQIADMAKHKDPDDAKGRSIKEVFLGNRKDEFSLKCSVIQEYAVKSRMLAMTRAYEQGALTANCFTTMEQMKIRQKNGLGEDDEIGMSHMLAYVKENMKKSAAGLRAAYQRYFKGEEAKTELAKKQDFQLPSSHPNMDAALENALQNGKMLLGLKSHMDGSAMKKYYQLQKAQADELRKKWETYQEPEILEKVEQLEQELSYIEIEYALTSKHYQMAGDKNVLIKEPIFRSYLSADGMESFRNMGEENFIQMCRQLAAGALAENPTPEELEAYHAENVKGLLTYKKHMKEHYNSLEEKFHHSIPSLAYIVEHYEELKTLIANSQVDLNLVKHSKDMIDLRNDEDARLYHLIQYYHAFGSYVVMAYKYSVHGDEGYEKAMEAAAFELRDIDYSTRYLDEDHSALTESEREKKEELAEAVEGFRRVYIESKYSDEETPWEEQMARLNRIEGMMEYLKEHPDISPIEQEHIKDLYKYSLQSFDNQKGIWAYKQNSHANRKSYNIVEARYRLNQRTPERPDTIQELAEKLAAYQVTEEMLTPDYIINHIQELLASFDVMDAYRERLQAQPELEGTISPEQKLLWEKNRGIYGKYREYVTDYARSLHVNLASGEFLPEENLSNDKYLANKKENERKVANGKNTLQNLLGGFSGYAANVNTLSERIKGIKGLEENAKSAVLNSLSEAGAWLEDLTQYTKKPLIFSPESMFDAMLMTLMSMYGYLEKNLREAREALSGAAEVTQRGELLAEIQKISDTFIEFKERIPGQTQELRNMVLQSGAEIPLTFGDVIMRVQEKKIFVINGEEENVGAGASEVTKIKEGENTFFFKADEKLKSFQESAEEILPILENEEMANYIRTLVKSDENLRLEKDSGKTEQERAEAHWNQAELLSLLDEVTFIPKESNPEGYYNMLKDKYLRYLNGAVQKGFMSEEKKSELAEKVNAEPAFLEKWEEFVKALSKKYTVSEVTTHRKLLLNEGADMTARNYASERVAELLGLKNLIVRNREAVVEKNGVQEKGFVMDKADGVSASDVVSWLYQDKAHEVRLTAEAQKQLLNLQILDNIIGQYDRHMGNYFFQCEKTDNVWTIVKVTAIDNDFAFGRSKEVGGSANTPSILEAKKTKTESGSKTEYLGYYPNMMDKELYEHLKAVSPELLAANLEGVIEPEYLEALKTRYTILRDAIMKAAEEKPDFFREKGGWNETSQKEMAEQKLSTAGAMTYLQRML